MNGIATAARYRIIKYPWHTAHDYELARLPHDFFYLTNTPRSWNEQQRPIPGHINWVGSVGQVPTDVMILHLDQWSHQEPAKRMLFLMMKRAYPGPKIVINHGCNMVDGCSSDLMADYVSGCTMVCNSRTAQELWGVPNSRFIRHGMDPEEWDLTSYAKDEVLSVLPDSRAHAAYRNLEGLARAEKQARLTWIGRDSKPRSFEQYRKVLQTHSIYFNPSFASPNPRARTEAMLSGLAIVTTDCHGESEFIENGVNGYCSNDMDELIEVLVHLQAHPDEARRIGMAGRVTAQRLFHIDRFIEQWNMLLDEVIGVGGSAAADAKAQKQS